ncbi:MAG: WG repeat-containing protein [Bacteroidia bacterium]|nr:WG repeat-containing protein [Bacteroidia bacterium]MDW8347340.1 WG repeat-containing protein [Bacteroidia bacterium]
MCKSLVCLVVAFFTSLQMSGQSIIVVRKKVKSINQDSICKAQTEKTLILFKQNNKWGTANGYEIIATPRYEYISVFNKHNLARVSQNGKYGCINAKGELIIPTQYDKITEFQQGVAFVQKGYSSPLIQYNKQTRKTKPIPLKNIDSTATTFYQGLLWYTQGRKYGLLDTNGNIISSAKFLQIRPFYEERAAVKLNQWGYVNLNGKIVIPCNYEEVTDFSEQKAAVFDGQYWTFIDTRGRFLTKQKYEDVKNFQEGYCPVKRKGIWFLIDSTFKRCFKHYFDNLKTVSEGALPAKIQDKWGIIDLKGRWLLQPNFENIEPFSEGVSVAQKQGFLLIQRQDMSIWRLPTYIEKVLPCKNGYIPYKSQGKWGFLNKQGQIIISAQYDTVLYFTEGLACVKQNQQWGCINASHQVVIPFREVKQMSSFYKNTQYILLDTREENLPAFAAIDTLGNILSPFDYTDVSFQNNQILVKKEGYWYKWKDQTVPIAYSVPQKRDTIYTVSTEITRTENGLKWTIKNNTQDLIFDTYTQAKEWLELSSKRQKSNITSKYNTNAITYSEGIGIIKVKDKLGCIDSVGNLIVEPKYDEINPFRNGFATVRIGNKWGMINKNGKEVILCTYEQLGVHSERRVEFKKNEKSGFLDLEGRVVIKPEYERVTPFSEGKAAVFKQGLWGYIDTLGNVVIPFAYTQAKPFKDSLAAVQKDFRKYGYINHKNQIVIDFQFDDAESFFGGIAFVNIDNTWVEINRSGEVQRQNSFSTNTNLVPPIEPVKMGAKWSFIDKQKRLVYPPQFDLVRHYWGDLMEIIRTPENTTKPRLYGIINKRTGQIILKPDCEDIKLIHF